MTHNQEQPWTDLAKSEFASLISVYQTEWEILSETIDDSSVILYVLRGLRNTHKEPLPKHHSEADWKWKTKAFKKFLFSTKDPAVREAIEVNWGARRLGQVTEATTLGLTPNYNDDDYKGPSQLTDSESSKDSDSGEESDSDESMPPLTHVGHVTDTDSDAASVASTAVDGSSSRTKGRCRYWDKYGTCKYGDKCKFQHCESSSDSGDSEVTDSGLKLCEMFYKSGVCHFGDSCPYTHPPAPEITRIGTQPRAQEPYVDAFLGHVRRNPTMYGGNVNEPRKREWELHPDCWKQYRVPVGYRVGVGDYQNTSEHGRVADHWYSKDVYMKDYVLVDLPEPVVDYMRSHFVAKAHGKSYLELEVGRVILDRLLEGLRITERQEIDCRKYVPALTFDADWEETTQLSSVLYRKATNIPWPLDIAARTIRNRWEATPFVSKCAYGAGVLVLGVLVVKFFPWWVVGKVTKYAVKKTAKILYPGTPKWPILTRPTGAVAGSTLEAIKDLVLGHKISPAEYPKDKFGNQSTPPCARGGGRFAWWHFLARCPKEFYGAGVLTVNRACPGPDSPLFGAWLRELRTHVDFARGQFSDFDRAYFGLPFHNIVLAPIYEEVIKQYIPYSNTAIIGYEWLSELAMTAHVFIDPTDLAWHALRLLARRIACHVTFKKLSELPGPFCVLGPLSHCLWNVFATNFEMSQLEEVFDGIHEGLKFYEAPLLTAVVGFTPALASVSSWFGWKLGTILASKPTGIPKLLFPDRLWFGGNKLRDTSKYKRFAATEMLQKPPSQEPPSRVRVVVPNLQSVKRSVITAGEVEHFYMMLYGLGSREYVPMIPKNTLAAQLNTVQCRIAGVTPLPDEQFVARFNKFRLSDEFCRTAYPTLWKVRRVRPVPWDMFRAKLNSTPARLKLIDAAKVRLDALGITAEGPLLTARLVDDFTKRGFFGKGELLNYISWGGQKTRSQRGIADAPPELVVLVGPWVVAYQGIVKKDLKGDNALWHGSGKTGREVGEWVARGCIKGKRKGKNDFTLFDSSQGKQIILGEVAVCAKFGAPPVVVQLLSRNATPRGRTQGGIKVSVPKGMRCSGDSGTTIFNSENNRNAVLFVYKEYHQLTIRQALKNPETRIDIFGMGDDGDVEHPVGMDVPFDRELARLGFTSKFEYYNKLTEAEVLSSRVLRCSGGHVLTPKPGRLFARLGYFYQPPAGVSPEALVRGTALGLAKAVNHCPPAAALIRRMLELTEGHEAYQVRQEEWKLSYPTSYEATADTWADLHEIYGWDPEKQRELERYLSTLQLGEAASHPYITLLCDADTSGPSIYPKPQ